MPVQPLTQAQMKLFQDYLTGLSIEQGEQLLDHINRVNLAVKINPDPQFLEDCVKGLVEEHPILNEIFWVK